MHTLVKEGVDQAQAVSVEFQNTMLILNLSDGRQVWLPMDKIKWLAWLLAATPEQRAKWEILPHGYGVYWDELDDGFEVEHALRLNLLQENAILSVAR